MNPVNPKKLLHSKWTAVNPQRREKHFIVTEVRADQAGNPQTCILEAVHSKREIQTPWRELKNDQQWQSGWR